MIDTCLKCWSWPERGAFGTTRTNEIDGCLKGLTHVFSLSWSSWTRRECNCGAEGRNRRGSHNRRWADFSRRDILCRMCVVTCKGLRRVFWCCSMAFSKHWRYIAQCGLVWFSGVFTGLALTSRRPSPFPHVRITAQRSFSMFLFRRFVLHLYPFPLTSAMPRLAYGAPDLVTATFVQRNYRAEKSTFFLSVW